MADGAIGLASDLDTSAIEYDIVAGTETQQGGFGAVHGHHGACGDGQVVAGARAVVAGGKDHVAAALDIRGDGERPCRRQAPAAAGLDAAAVDAQSVQPVDAHGAARRDSL